MEKEIKDPIDLATNKPKGGYKLKHIFSPSRWFAVITGILLEKYLSYEYCEQVVWRKLRCDEYGCFERGYCDSCNCETPALFMNVSETTECSRGKWPGYMPPDEWSEYCKLMDIELMIKQ